MTTCVPIYKMKNKSTLRLCVNIYLITLNAPDFDDASFNFDQLKGVHPVEDGASVGPVVALDVNARRVRFREINSVITLGPQGFR